MGSFRLHAADVGVYAGGSMVRTGGDAVARPALFLQSIDVPCGGGRIHVDGFLPMAQMAVHYAYAATHNGSSRILVAGTRLDTLGGLGSVGIRFSIIYR